MKEEQQVPPSPKEYLSNHYGNKPIRNWLLNAMSDYAHLWAKWVNSENESKLPPPSQQDRSVSQPGKEIGNIFDLYINEEITKEEAIKRVKDLSQPSQPGEGKGDEYNPKPGQYGNRQFKKLAEGDFSNAEAPERLLPEQGNETRSMNSIMDDNVTMFNSGIPLWDKHAVNKCCREWEAALKSRPSEGWSEAPFLKDFTHWLGVKKYPITGFVHLKEFLDEYKLKSQTELK